MGTIMEFNDGEPRRVLVLDAKYRSNQQPGLSNVDMNLPTYPASMYLFKTESSSTSTTPAEAAAISDEWINTNVLVDENTSRYNCDMWMQHSDVTDENGVVGSPAVTYCRSILVKKTPCDLPNIQTLTRIYCDAEALDSMDPTIENYPILALGSQNPQGAWNIGQYEYNGEMQKSIFTCSSTAGNNQTEVFIVTSLPYGGAVNAPKNATYSIVPVLELESA